MMKEVSVITDDEYQFRVTKSSSARDLVIILENLSSGDGGAGRLYLNEDDLNLINELVAQLKGS